MFYPGSFGFPILFLLISPFSQNFSNIGFEFPNNRCLISKLLLLNFVLERHLFECGEGGGRLYF